MKRAPRRVIGTCVVLAAAAGVVLVVSCSAPDPSARVDPIGPDFAQFKDVAPMFSRNCGSLDCHGSKFRNFRVYGYGGTRLDGGVTPESPAREMDDELQATYDAIIGLEPEIMRDVVQSGGAGVERLTLVRKARNTEAHKGNQRIKPGDDSDICLVSWLGSSASNPIKTLECHRAGCVQPNGTIDCTKPVTQ